MTPSEFDAALETIGWSVIQIGERTGWSEGAVRNWRKGAPPADVAAWLQQAAAFTEEAKPGAIPPEERAMFRKEMVAAVEAAGLSYRQVAARSGVPHRTVLRWKDGEGAIPDWFAAWLRALAHWHRMNPPPRGWRHRYAAP